MSIIFTHSESEDSIIVPLKIQIFNLIKQNSIINNTTLTIFQLNNYISDVNTIIRMMNNLIINCNLGLGSCIFHKTCIRV